MSVRRLTWEEKHDKLGGKMKVAFTTFLMLLASLPVLAEEAKFKPLIVIVDEDRGPMDSCIGIPVTPLCAFKTWISCYSGVPSSCIAIGVVPSEPNERWYPGFDKAPYRITEVAKVNPEIVPLLPTGRNPSGVRWFDPDDLMISYSVWLCTTEGEEEKCKWWDGGDTVIALRSIKGRWVLAWWEPSDLTCGERYSSSPTEFKGYCHWVPPRDVLEGARLPAEARGIEPKFRIDPKSLLKPGFASVRVKTE